MEEEYIFKGLCLFWLIGLSDGTAVAACLLLGYCKSSKSCCPNLQRRTKQLQARPDVRRTHKRYTVAARVNAVYQVERADDGR